MSQTSIVPPTSERCGTVRPLLRGPAPGNLQTVPFLRLVNEQTQASTRVAAEAVPLAWEEHVPLEAPLDARKRRRHGRATDRRGKPRLLRAG